MSRVKQVSLTVWVTWVLFAHALGAAAIGLRRDGPPPPPRFVVVGFDVRTLNAAPGAAPLPVPVRADPPAEGVEVAVEPSGAEDGADFALASRSLRLNSDSTLTPLVVNVRDNPGRTSERTLRLKLKPAARRVQIDPDRDVATVVLPAHSQGVEVAFIVPEMTVSEGQRRAEATVRLDPVPSRPVTVLYSVAEGPAAEVRVAAGSPTAQLPFDVPSDSARRGVREFSVALLPGAGVQTGDPARLRVTVREKEPEPVLTVTTVRDTAPEGGNPPLAFRLTLSGRSASPVTVRCQPGGDAPRGVPQEFALSAGETGREFPVPVDDDKSPGPDRTFILTFRDARGARLDPEAPTLTFTVRDDDGLKGRAAVLVLKTAQLDFMRDVVKAQLAQLYASRAYGRGSGVLLDDTFFVVKKGADLEPWVPDTAPPSDAAGRFGTLDPPDEVLNDALQAADGLRKKAASKDFVAVILWPSARDLGRMAFDPTKVRLPEGLNVRLVSLGARPEGTDKLEALFAGKLRFLADRDQITELQDHLVRFLDETDPKNPTR